MNPDPVRDVASVLDPAGVEAAVLHELTVVLFVGAAVILAIAFGLLAVALRRGPRRDVPAAWWVVGGGFVFPTLVLGALLLYATARGAGLERPLADPALVVSVRGHVWWWEVRYRDPRGGPDVVLANEIRVPVGRPTQLGLSAADVIHSFWVPQLGGKRDLVPGRVNSLVVTPTRAGVFRGACAEYCGTQHAKMALHVVAMPADDFDRWLAAQARDATAAPPAAAAAFREHGCAACHVVRGVFDGPAFGPDLTHVASRLALGAGALDNDAGAIKRWLVGVQRIKPGARMPSYAHLDAATLDALAGWLERLR